MAIFIPSLESLLRHHIATEQQPLPPPGPGIAWIWAANGIFKLGQDAHRRVLVRVGSVPDVPGLVSLAPGVTWFNLPRLLPGQILSAMLIHARKAEAPTAFNGFRRPIEAQYHVTLEGARIKVRVPEQTATPGSVVYQMTDAPVLLDLHSHHAMPAYFSATDDRDDTGLGVSAVIGRIFHTRPEIVVRLCCYGHTHIVPAWTIFDGIGPFFDTYEDHINAHP